MLEGSFVESGTKPQKSRLLRLHKAYDVVGNVYFYFVIPGKNVARFALSYEQYGKKNLSFC